MRFDTTTVWSVIVKATFSDMLFMKNNNNLRLTSWGSTLFSFIPVALVPEHCYTIANGILVTTSEFPDMSLYRFGFTIQNPRQPESENSEDGENNSDQSTATLLLSRPG